MEAHAPTLATASARPADRERRLGPATILIAVAAANAAVMVWLWAKDGGITGAHGDGGLATSIGRITGLLGAYLALIQVLLLARLPWLERLVGFDRLTVWHRWNGRACITLILAHVVFITAGYQRMDQISLRAEISSLLHDYPGMVLATVGTALMLVVVFTSVVLVRRRLPYELWYGVHLSAYAAIVFAYVHQIPTGNELAADHQAQQYWKALYILALALILTFRVLVPLMRVLRHRIRVTDVVDEGGGVASIRLQGRDLERLGARPGQFMRWRFLTRGLWWQSHPFSLSEAPVGDSLRFTVKEVGRYTAKVPRVRPGTRVAFEGPFGTFTSAARRHPGVVLIAGGIGITPVRALLEELPAGAGPATVIYRAIRPEDLVLRAEVERLAATRGADLHCVVGHHEDHGADRLLSPEHLTELVPDLGERDVYLCGPPAMTSVVLVSLRRAGVPRRHIHHERFAL